MPVTLGRLITVPLREVWQHEAGDFTPWLATPENLGLLAETLGLGELEIQGVEVPVGSFFIDILARDLRGEVVVIENQFGATDHGHLGQILTYIAGQDGKATIIWIAERFREEHRAAIDWLNASTIEGFNFFAVEVEALRIGESAPAPWFNVVGKPNTWSRNVTRATLAGNDRPMDARQKVYAAYWAGFGDYLNSQDTPFRVRGEPRDYWCGFGKVLRSGFGLGATAVLRDNRIGVEIYISHSEAKVAFDTLEAQKEVIEAEYGGPLVWQRLNDRKGCRIAIFRPDSNPANEDQRPIQYAWFLEQLSRFSRAFRSRIAGLDLEPDEGGSIASQASGGVELASATST